MAPAADTIEANEPHIEPPAGAAGLSGVGIGGLGAALARGSGCAAEPSCVMLRWAGANELFICELAAALAAAFDGREDCAETKTCALNGFTGEFELVGVAVGGGGRCERYCGAAAARGTGRGMTGGGRAATCVDASACL